MYAQEVSMHLKGNAGAEFTRTIEQDILPRLRKQTGFADELTFLNPNGKDAIAISLWDRKENADAYSRDTYPDVLKSLAAVVEGTPQVQAYEVANSTFHKIAARNQGRPIGSDEGRRRGGGRGRPLTSGGGSTSWLLRRRRS